MELLREYQFRVEHDHGDGSWGLMDEDSDHHGAAAHDPERGWVRKLFRCDSCNETVRVIVRDVPSAPEPE